MQDVRSRLDRFAVALARTVIRWRYVTIAASLAIAATIFMNAMNVGIANNYRVFFSNDNPELIAFETFQSTYTKNDNFLFVVEPKSGDSFDPATLTAVEALTEGAWQIPFSIRVDSVTNFQSTRAIEDDLIVEDLVRGAEDLDAEALAEKKAIALAEPLLSGQLLTADADVTAINVVLQYPERDLTEVPSAAQAARDLRDRIEAEHPGVAVTLTGVSMLNNAFAESGMADMMTLIPLMYLVVLLAAVVALRSLSGTAATLLVITGSVMVAMGAAGLMRIDLTPISFSAPTVIMTLAVADSVHILMSMRAAMRRGMAKIDALVDAIRVNFLAVSITSLTTIVGFLALNFSDAPPFWHLGNITAVGIFAAWALSLTLLPAVISLLPVKVAVRDEDARDPAMRRLADWVIAWRKILLGGSVAVSALLIALIPTIDFNDQWVEYFDERIEFRTESDIALRHFGLYPIEFSVPSGQPGGVSEPDFLERLEGFTDWLRSQPQVTHVYSLADIMKRLNKNMHADEESYYRIPEDRELSAQYLLLYELSLPFGLDLNDRVNIDKSATRVTATLGNVTTQETKQFLAAAEAYIAETFPEEQRAKPTSAQVMFTYITDRNVQSMILGTTVAILAISAIMIVTLRSVPLGLLSLVPNALPILTTFGIWALLVGQVGFSVATVASISLGIIVDDTVHFLTKYQRARRENGYGPEDAIRYAFETVGAALIANTVILVLGFLVLTYSSFKMNVDMGLMTVIAIILALVIDFLLLPALLLLGGKSEAVRTPDSAPQAA
ncbi:MAG: MMPL family transporter [Pseudomonadota bacterium]